MLLLRERVKERPTLLELWVMSDFVRLCEMSLRDCGEPSLVCLPERRSPRRWETT